MIQYRRMRSFLFVLVTALCCTSYVIWAQQTQGVAAWTAKLLAGTPGVSGTNDGPGLQARFSEVGQMWGDGTYLYVADTNNAVIRKIHLATGVVSTLAGRAGVRGTVDGPGTTTLFANPWGLWSDGNGLLYVCDTNNGTIRRVATVDGTTSTFVGRGPTAGFMDGIGPNAQFKFPSEIWGDGTSLYVTDWGNHAIRKIDIATRNVTTIAGGSQGTADGIGLQAAFFNPEGIWGNAGFLYVSDGNHTIRKIEIATRTVTTIAGTPAAFGYLDGPGKSTRFNTPWGLWGDGKDLYIVDNGNHIIRKMSFATEVVSSVAGSPGDAGAEDGTGASARFRKPQNVWSDGTNMYVADSRNFTVRTLMPAVGPLISLADRGLKVLSTSGQNPTARLGYGRLNALSGVSTPVGLALFAFRQGGNLISETAVPASAAVTSGRIFAEVGGSVNTGIAIANPNDRAANVVFFFTSVNGTDFGSGITTIPARGQISRFLNEAPFNGGAAISGSFTFQSDVPVAVIALRGLTNQRSDFILSTLPVASLTTVQPPNLIFPHFADGEGWSTQLILINPTDNTLSGTMQFYDRGSDAVAAQPLSLQVDDVTGSTFPYTLPGKSARSFKTGGTGTIKTGSVRATTIGNQGVVGLVVFSYKSGNITVTEAGVPALRSIAVQRMYVEAAPGSEQSGANSVQSGIAIANPSAAAGTAQIELYDLNGVFTGLSTVITIPPSGQVAKFLNELPSFQSLPTPFRGILRVSSASGGLNLVGLRGRYNERGDFLITTTTPVEEFVSPSNTEVFFPHLVDSGGYTTQFIMFNAYRNLGAGGLLQLFSQNGDPLNLTIN